jgi:hypothetical protein
MCAASVVTAMVMEVARMVQSTEAVEEVKPETSDGEPRWGKLTSCCFDRSAKYPGA